MSRAVLLALLVLVPPQQQPPGADDGVSVDEIEKDYLDRLGRAQEARDWRSFFAHVQKGLQTRSMKVVAVGKDRWVGLREYLCGRIAALPKEALEYYRLQQDGPASAG